MYAVNSMSFHPQFGTFVTAGSDGAYNFWDKDSKQRLKAMAKCSMPIPCGDFNRWAGGGPRKRACTLVGLSTVMRQPVAGQRGQTLNTRETRAVAW